MRQYFGTDGVRGRFGVDPMTPEFVYRLGLAAAEFFIENKSGNDLVNGSKRIVIARDTRESGAVLESALVAGFVEKGLEPIYLGVIPTGAVSTLTIKSNALAGVMISASHNPWRDNGIKFFQSSGYKLTDQQESEIEALMIKLEEKFPELSQISLTFNPDRDAMDSYFDHIASSVPEDFSLEGKKVVVDTANGASWMTTPSFFKRIGAEVISIAQTPNGRNINEECGSQHPEAAAKAVVEHSASIGICHDGDADRLVIIDETGSVLDGDEVMAILALGYHRMGKLKGSTLVTTVMSNLGLDECLQEEGISVHRTGVGDRYVMEGMLEGGYVLGGEQSGHLIFLDHAPTGDGLLSAIQFLNVVQEFGEPISQLRQRMRKYPQRLVNIEVREKIPFSEVAGLADFISESEAAMGAEGRLLLRYSGTENKCRVLVEAKSSPLLEQISQPLIEKIQAELGVE
ncbi:MAG: phosphoglucosamine mutase [Verrucomicrobiota bacterium]